jgi:hypothetical protein
LMQGQGVHSSFGSTWRSSRVVLLHSDREHDIDASGTSA